MTCAVRSYQRRANVDDDEQCGYDDMPVSVYHVVYDACPYGEVCE